MHLQSTASCTNLCKRIYWNNIWLIVLSSDYLHILPYFPPENITNAISREFRSGAHSKGSFSTHTWKHAALALKFRLIINQFIWIFIQPGDVQDSLPVARCCALLAPTLHMCAECKQVLRLVNCLHTEKDFLCWSAVFCMFFTNNVFLMLLIFLNRRCVVFVC